MPTRLSQILACTTPIALAAMSMLLAFGTAAHAQSMRSGGSIGVSLTILPPVATESARLLGFDVDRNGLATLRMSAPASRPASRIVMTSVVAESMGAAPRRVATLAPSAGSSAPLRYVVDLGRSPEGEPRQPVQLRLQYLTVAGT